MFTHILYLVTFVDTCDYTRMVTVDTCDYTRMVTVISLPFV